MSSSEPPEARHQQRMQRKKAVVDTKMAAATIDRGLIIVNTGIGKGKSSSGFGMVARAIGNDMKVGVVQFIKGALSTGEEKFFRRFPESVQYFVMGEGYTWETQNLDRDKQKAELARDTARGLLRDPAVGLVLLDELNIALKYRYLDVQAVIADLQARPPMQHVVITGRGAPEALIECADTVTDMSLVKHAFQAGVRAQRGVEW